MAIDLNLPPPHSPSPPHSPPPLHNENQEEEQVQANQEIEQVQENQEEEQVLEDEHNNVQQLQHFQNMGQQQWIPLPPGMVFKPTDADIVNFYLQNKLVDGEQFVHHHGLVFEADLYSTPPDALLQQYRNDKGIAYIFSPRYRLHPNSVKKVRRTVIGDNQVLLGRWARNLPAVYMDENRQISKAGFVYYEVTNAYRHEEDKTDYMVKEFANSHFTLPLEAGGNLLDRWAFYKLYDNNAVDPMDVI